MSLAPQLLVTVEVAHARAVVIHLADTGFGDPDLRRRDLLANHVHFVIPVNLISIVIILRGGARENLGGVARLYQGHHGEPAVHCATLERRGDREQDPGSHPIESKLLGWSVC